MTVRDVTFQLLQDLRAGLELLTRLPVPAGTSAPRSDAAWTWPIIGTVVAALGIVGAVMALRVGLPVATSALIFMVVTTLASGALHEDGLADCADGFYGGRNKARRLEIMKDSQIGSYGTLALVLAALLRWTLLSDLLAGGFFVHMIVAAALSRAMMAAVMAAVPNARGTGVSQSVGRPTYGAAGVALALAVLGGVATTGWITGLLTLAALGFAAATAGVAKAKIGGQTGDVLGAVQQISEIGILLTAVIVV